MAPAAMRIHLGGVMQIFPHSDVDMWGMLEWAVLGGVDKS